MKKIWSMAIAGSVVLGAFSVVPVFAATNSEPSTTAPTEIVEKVKGLNFFGVHNGMKGFFDNHEIMNEKIMEQAAELGVDTENKDSRELMQDIREAELLAKAKELGVDTTNQSFREIAQAVMETQILQEAEDLGIDTTDKGLRQIAQEVQQAKVLQVAEKLGIDTTDKTTKEIMMDIKKDYIDEAEELNLFTRKGDGMGYGFDKGGKRGLHRQGDWHFKAPADSTKESAGTNTSNPL